MSVFLPTLSLLAALPIAPTAPTPSADAATHTAHLRDFEVIEFRRYTISNGERATFARHFESWFPEAFQQLGAIAFGQFNERGSEDRFTWLRGFRNSDERARVNAAFYYGPVWKEHAATMNDRLVDHTNVLLLKPLTADSGIPVLPAVDPIAEPDGARGIVVAQVFALKPGEVDAFARRAQQRFDAYRRADARAAGLLTTLDGPNTFPQLSVRTDGPYVVWLGIVENDAAVQRLRTLGDGFVDDDAWRTAPEWIVLEPTARSRLRWIAATR